MIKYVQTNFIYLTQLYLEIIALERHTVGWTHYTLSHDYLLLYFYINKYNYFYMKQNELKKNKVHK